MQKLLQLWKNLFTSNSTKVEDIISDLESTVIKLNNSVEEEVAIERELSQKAEEIEEQRKVSAGRQERGQRVANKIKELID